MVTCSGVSNYMEAVMNDKEIMQMALDALEAAYHPDTKVGVVMELLADRLAQTVCNRCGKVDPAEVHTCTPIDPLLEALRVPR